MSDHKRAWRLAACAVALLCLGACATGDFGRQNRSDAAMQAFFTPPGPNAINRTDAEQAMHDRIWRFLRPARSTALVETELPRKMKPDQREAARTAYYRWLAGTEFRSASVRYDAMADDVRTDLDTLPATFAAICAVGDVNRQRRVAAAGLASIEDTTRMAVALRAQSNAEDITRFAGALRLRFDAYSYALDHLLVETPDPAAVNLDLLVASVGAFADKADAGQFCAGAPAVPAAGAPKPRTLMQPVELEPGRGAYLMLPQMRSPSAASSRARMIG